MQKKKKAEIICTNPNYFKCTCFRKDNDKILCESVALICEYKKEEK